jgi:hypothetical protein
MKRILLFSALIACAFSSAMLHSMDYMLRRIPTDKCPNPHVLRQGGQLPYIIFLLRKNSIHPQKWMDKYPSEPKALIKILKKEFPDIQEIQVGYEDGLKKSIYKKKK